MENILAGSTISFEYKGGRFVRGVVEIVADSVFWLKLETDYIGKNEDWEAGEIKCFNIKECKKLIILSNANKNS